MSLFSPLLGFLSASIDKIKAGQLFDEAKALFDAKDYKAALPLMKEAAEKGSPHAMAHIGIMYLKGLGVPCDWKRAAEVLEMAIAVEKYQGTYFSGALIKSNLGMIHGIGGYNLKRDLARAAQYLREASAEGDEQSTELLKAVEERKGVFGQKEKAKPDIRW